MRHEKKYNKTTRFLPQITLKLEGYLAPVVDCLYILVFAMYLYGNDGTSICRLVAVTNSLTTSASCFHATSSGLSMKSVQGADVQGRKGHICPPSDATHPSDRWESLFVYAFICKFTQLRGKVEGLETPME